MAEGGSTNTSASAGNITFNTDADIDTRATERASGATSGAGGAVILDTNAGGTITLHDTSIQTAGGIASGTYGAGGTITISDALTLGTGAVSLDTGSTAGGVTISSTIDGAVDLDISSGTGAVAIQGVVV